MSIESTIDDAASASDSAGIEEPRTEETALQLQTDEPMAQGESGEIEDVDEDFDGDEDFIIDDDDEEDEEDLPSGRAYMQNRELSWLTFNERVLDQGADESVPLLERLNFISIFWSNLQEFFMVRVGSLTDLSYIQPPVIDSKTGMTPDDQIEAIHLRCHELYPIQESTYEHVRGSLAKEGVRHLRPEDLSDEQRNYLFGLVRHNIEPFLSPQIINSRHPFPHLENGKLYILVRLDDEEGADGKSKKKGKKKKEKDKAKKGNGGAEGVVLGLIPLPHQCERVIKLPGRGFQFILLEHAIEMFVPEIFSMYKIKHTNVICVTRNADIDANQTGDEQDEDYREHMKRLLKQRARLAPVRLECERPLSPVMEKLMLKKLGLKKTQVYDTIVPLDLSFTWGLGSRLTEAKRARLSNEPLTPAWPTCFDRKRRIIDQVQEKEVLISYPYESMDPFVQLLREAANDPDVISIKITLYRLASQSHLAEALIAAADLGKEVTALFELRARFDENNNIIWSQRFEQAGCNVIYGFRDYKVHSKICCITRRLPDGSLQHITQLGTGNYNEKTARLYTDFSFITTNEEFGQDAVEFFRNMQLENVSDNYKVLCVAPLQIKTMILDNLQEQMRRAKAGLPAHAFMKANSITDKDVIEKIAEASCAGVKITLFIRGICCLVPRIKGATENVRVVSIVGRLLEHSRIYCFGPADDCKVYLSSADLMTRNLNKRVEIAWPLLDAGIRNQVLSYIDVCMRDTAKLRELRPNATYTPLGAFCDLDEEGNPEPSFDAQFALIDQAAEAAAEAKAAAELEESPQLALDFSPEPASAAPVATEVFTETTTAAPAFEFVSEAAPLITPEPEPVFELIAEAAPLIAPEPEPAFEFASETAPLIVPEPEPTPASAFEFEQAPEASSLSVPEPEPVLSDALTAPEPEPAPAAVATPNQPIILGDDSIQVRFVDFPEDSSIDEPQPTLLGFSQPEDKPQPSEEVPTLTEPTRDFAAELAAAVATTPAQPAGNAQTDATALAQDAATASEAATSLNVSELVAQLGMGSDMSASASQNPAQTVQPASGIPVNRVAQTAQAAAQAAPTPTPAEQATAAAAPSPTQDTKFFDGEGRALEMPPQKKRSFFARLFNR